MNRDNVRVVGSAWLRMRRTEGRLGDALARHAVEHYGAGSLMEAWDEFVLWDDAPFDPEDLSTDFSSVFEPWFQYNWIPDNAEYDSEDHLPAMPVARHYLEHGGAPVDTFTKRFIEEACSQPFSFFMVTDVRRGQSMAMKDLLCRREFRVSERRGTETIKKGHILFARIVTLDGDSIMLGCGSCVIPAAHAGYFFDRRDDMAKSGSEGLELLNDWDFELREIYFGIRDDLMNPGLPEMRNTDDEPLQPVKLHYSLNCSPQEATDALAPLTLDMAGAIENTARYNSDGRLRFIELPWSKKGNTKNRTWSNTMLGNIVIDGGKLTVEVNSRERAEAFRGEMSRRLGEKAEFRHEVLTSLEKMLEEANVRPGGGAGSSRGARARRTKELNDLPEVKQMLKEKAAEHWRHWLDEPLPALNGQSPRKAAKSEKGRERLEALLWDFESRISGQPFDPDVAALRKNLGID